MLMSFKKMITFDYVKMLLFVLLFCIGSYGSLALKTDDPIVIEVTWTAHDYVLHTTPSLQIVTNPLVSRQFSPVSKHIFDSLAQLNAEYTRFAAWFPYPKMGVAELDPPSGLLQCGNVGDWFSVHLSCAQSGGVIDSIDFASYGTATGACGQMKQGSCHAANSLDIVKQACLGKSECNVPASPDVFGDPCESFILSHKCLRIIIWFKIIVILNLSERLWSFL